MEDEHRPGNHLVTTQGVELLAGLMALAPLILTMAAEHRMEVATGHPLGHQGPRLQPTGCQTLLPRVQKHPATAAAATIPGVPRHPLISNLHQTTIGALTSSNLTVAGALIHMTRRLLVSTCPRLLLRQ